MLTRLTRLGQQSLSDRLECVAVEAMLDPAGGLTVRERALLRLQREPYAGAWLLAVPSHATGNTIDPQLFLLLLRRRLCIPVFDTLSFCPMCAGVLDRWGDHALACAGGGDRTMRHNAVRDLLVRFAQSAGHAAVAENPGLLPPRPSAGASLENGAVLAAASARPEDRRPADVWLAAWSGGLPAAIDLAVTSGLQLGLTAQSAADGSVACARYEERKRAYLDTAKQCADASLTFVPFIVEGEGEGGLGPCARTVVASLAAASARLTGESASVRAGLCTQALSVALQRANALAIARRIPCAAPDLAAPLAAAKAELRFAAAAAPPPSALLALTACGSSLSSPPPLCTPRRDSRSPAVPPAAPPPPLPAPPAAASAAAAPPALLRC
eukprot:gene19764-biopygen9659